MKILDSNAADHSTSDQDFQCKESLNATVPTTFGSEDGEKTLQLSNTTLIALLRQSDLNNGKTTPWKSNPTEDQLTSE
jgi:hypothetical protein